MKCRKLHVGEVYDIFGQIGAKYTTEGMKTMQNPTQGIIVLHEEDNVATTIFDLPACSSIMLADGRTLSLCDPIPAGHKVALADLPAKAEVIKYGEVIGTATKPILAGQHVHVHNVQSMRGRVI